MFRTNIYIMFARTYNIFRTQVFVKVSMALAALVVLIISSCSSDNVIEEIPEIQPSETDKLSFTCNVQDNIQQANTRANEQQPLTTGFMVSTYKAYAEAKQQMVMEKYNVERKTSGTAWDGTVRPYWDYTQVAGQYEKYWDFSNFPYRFHAIAPCPQNPSDFVLNDKQLTIAAPYYYQTCTNGSVFTTTASGISTIQPAEPYMLAQVHRAASGEDTDLIATNEEKRKINTGSSSLNRTVWMPFHHLNSKIRFGVYSLQSWVSANHLYIEGLTIKVTSNDFVTKANCYQASVNGLTDDWCIDTGTSGFSGLTKQTDVTLFRFDGGKNVEGNDMRDCQTQKTAFMLQCPGGLMQLPQDNVQMAVSFKLMTPGGDLYKEFTNVPIVIQLPDETLQPLHTWQPGYIYTYYLIIGGIEDKLEISFTATLNEWTDVSGSLETDLEK